MPSPYFTPKATLINFHKCAVVLLRDLLDTQMGIKLLANKNILKQHWKLFKKLFSTTYVNLYMSLCMTNFT